MTTQQIPGFEAPPVDSPVLDGGIDESAGPYGSTWELPASTTDTTDTPEAPETQEPVPAEEPTPATEPEVPAEGDTLSPEGQLFAVPTELLPPQEDPQAGIAEAERQELLRLRQRQAEFDQQEAIRNQNEEVRNIQQVYEAQGYDMETAALAARAYQQGMARKSAEAEEVVRAAQLQQNRITTAQIIGKKYGVHPDSLVNLDSPRSMEQYAILAADYNKKLQELSKRTELLEKTRVPEQHFAGAGAGEAVVTADNVDALWLQYERNYPGQANPYEEQYRRLLGA